MAISNDKLIAWFRDRVGKITYSMTGSRDGSDGTADCSGSVLRALVNAGGTSASTRNYSTLNLGTYLKANGYTLVYAGITANATGIKGDVILMTNASSMAGSAGSNGHTGVLGDNDIFWNTTATDWETGKTFLKGKGVQSPTWSAYKKVTRLKSYTEVWRRKSTSTSTTTVNKVKVPHGRVLVVDGTLGANTWKSVQETLKYIGHNLVIDGIAGKATIKALQSALNAKLKLSGNYRLVEDGIMGVATIKAWQRLMGTPRDGVISKNSQLIMKVQKECNAGNVWI